MILLDDWHDFLRLLVFLLCLFCAYLLVKRFRQHSSSWNTKTRDYWYSLFMWVLCGAVLCAQGVVLDYVFGPGLTFATFAVLVSVKGLCNKGAWGGDR